MTKSDSLVKIELYQWGEIMDFINRMKKREFIEMGLKTLAAILAAFVGIILMEGMIYGVLLNGLYTHASNSMAINTANKNEVIYAVPEGDEYHLIVHYTNETEWRNEWKGYSIKQTKEDLAKYDNIIYHAPNAFEFSIEPFHYAIMAVFILGIGGLFTYKFIRLAKSYKDIEKEFKETGTIELPNLE